VKDLESRLFVLHQSEEPNREEARTMRRLDDSKLRAVTRFTGRKILAAEMNLQSISTQWFSFRRIVSLWVIMGCLLLLESCATMGITQPEPVTVPQIIQMSKAGVPAQEIVKKMRRSGTVYRLKASQLAQLKEEGVPDSVIDYMQETYLDAVRNDQALEDRNRWTMEDDGFWYGGSPYGWPGY
jgi:hypothetical protein